MNRRLARTVTWMALGTAAWGAACSSSPAKSLAVPPIDGSSVGAAAGTASGDADGGASGADGTAPGSGTGVGSGSASTDSGASGNPSGSGSDAATPSEGGAAACVVPAGDAGPPPAASAYPNVPDMGDGTYRNPIVLADYSDPDVIRAGNEFYLVAAGG